MNDVVFKFLETSLITSAAVVLLLLLSMLLRNKTQPMLRRTCWIFIALLFLIPVRPALLSVSLPQEEINPALTSIYSQVRDYRVMLDTRAYNNINTEKETAGEQAVYPGQPQESSEISGASPIFSESTANSEIVAKNEQIITRHLDFSVILTFLWILGMITATIFYTSGYTRLHTQDKTAEHPYNMLCA